MKFQTPVAVQGLDVLSVSPVAAPARHSLIPWDSFWSRLVDFVLCGLFLVSPPHWPALFSASPWLQLSLPEEQNEVTRNGCESKELVYLVQISCQVNALFSLPSLAFILFPKCWDVTLPSLCCVWGFPPLPCSVPQGCCLSPARFRGGEKGHFEVNNPAQGWAQGQEWVCSGWGPFGGNTDTWTHQWPQQGKSQPVVCYHSVLPGALICSQIPGIEFSSQETLGKGICCSVP